MTLQKMLQQIALGKPVNYHKLLQLLPPVFYQQRQQLFKVNSSGANKWQVSIADPALFALLQQSVAAPADRVEATLQGDSHRALTSHSYVLVFHQALLNERPDLVLSAGRGNHIELSQGFLAKSRLLLIENEENFFNFRKVLALCHAMLAEPFSLLDCDVALAAGSRIGSALLTPYLAQYQQIYCAFDFDAAALEVFDHLVKRYGNQVQFVCPPDVTPWLNGFRAKASPNQLQKALQLAEQHHLYGLKQAFEQRKAFLEQEILLVDG